MLRVQSSVNQVLLFTSLCTLFLETTPSLLFGDQVALVVKNLPTHAGDIRDVGLIPGLGRSPGRGHSNPFQYSCLENPMDREAWWATVHGVAKSQTTEHTYHPPNPSKMSCMGRCVLHSPLQREYPSHQCFPSS